MARYVADEAMRQAIDRLRQQCETGEQRGQLDARAVLRASVSREFSCSAVLRARERVPVALDPKAESDRLSAAREVFESRIVGQREAIEALLAAWQLELSGLRPKRRPIASFLLLGPTGVGKTLLVETAAEALFPGETLRPLKVNCGEYQQEHEIAKLIGAPPGYLGHRITGARLSDEVLNHHRSERTGIALVLFDEVEKAHPALHHLLLGILDRAELLTGENKAIDFSATLVFLTGNVGGERIADLVDEHGLGFCPAAERGGIRTAAEAAARRTFRPEFLARLDRLVVFSPLSDEEKRRIVAVEVGKAQLRLAARGVLLEVSAGASEFVLARGTDQRSGARNVRRTVERELVAPMAALLANGQARPGDHILAEARGEAIEFARVAGC